MDIALIRIMEQAVKLFKDKTVHYVIGISDGEEVSYKYDSKIAAKGIVDMIQQDITEDWKESRPTVADIE